MKCPNCNNEIKDGFLLCGVCGKELSYVPTFDAQIEGEMDKALSDVNLAMQDTIDLSGNPEIAITKDLSKTTDVTELYQKLGKNTRQKITIHKGMLFGALLFLVFAIVVSLFIRNQIKSNSYAELMKRANESIENGEYSVAIPLLEAAIKKADANDDAFYALANSYYLTDDLNNAELVLKDIIDKTPNSRDAYALLITIYESQSKYEDIRRLLTECEDTSIYDEFRQYVAPQPGFSDDEGSYDKNLSLSILVDSPGVIYYTLDGSEPDENATRYTEPILLTDGKWVVRAVFINEYGISSESVSKIYDISSKLPDPPSILPENAEFNNPEYIYVNNEPDKVVYYTTDGTMPDENSNEYIYPIPMKTGDIIYKFISIDEDGVKSDVCTKNYTLNVNGAFNESEAVNYLVNNFTALGKLADVSGVAANLDGMYMFKCLGVITLGDRIAYLIEENYKSIDSDTYVSTDNYYAVDIITAAIENVFRNTDGIFEIK